MLLTLLSMSAYAYESALDEAIEKAKQLTESLNIQSIFKSTVSYFTSYFSSLKWALGICSACLITTAVFSALKHSFGRCGEIFDTISSAMLVLCVLSVLIPCFQYTESSISRICAYVTAASPTITALLYASGNSVTAASSAFTTSLAVSLVQLITVCLVLPVTRCCCTLSAVNAICKKDNLGGICSFLKSCSLWITGLSFTIFTGIISLQTALLSSADNLALKGVKFAAARLIPVAGSMVSESMKTVIASMSYIKSVTGIGGIVFILYTAIPPMCVILATKLLFLAMSALSRSVSAAFACSLFDSINSTLNVLCALLISCTVAFIIIIGLFVKVTVNL